MMRIAVKRLQERRNGHEFRAGFHHPHDLSGGTERILDVLLPQLVQAQVLRALLESNAAFFAAQMTAMDAATRNSSEMIENLTLYMNKVRQAAITREIIEVVSGAAAT